MRVEPMTVVGPDQEAIDVSPGDVWPLPYRGSRYTVLRMDGADVVAWSRYEQRIFASDVPPELPRHVRLVKDGGLGSFRVTAHGAIVAKVSVSDDGRWEPRYVGVYEGGLQFEGIDNNPSGLRKGMYWTGFPFNNGETWSVSPYSRSRNQLQWRKESRWFVSTKRYPEILQTCLDIRPRGGRIYITECGHIWMNVPDGGISPRYCDEFQMLQREQIDRLQAEGNGVLLRLLVKRMKATKTRPVYVGQVRDFDHGEPPWTRYSARRHHGFGTAGGDVADDQLRHV